MTPDQQSERERLIAKEASKTWPNLPAWQMSQIVHFTDRLCESREADMRKEIERLTDAMSWSEAKTEQENVGLRQSLADRQERERELKQWLQAQILEDEGAKINAAQRGEWDRYYRLDGHRDAMVSVQHLQSFAAAQETKPESKPEQHCRICGQPFAFNSILHPNDLCVSCQKETKPAPRLECQECKKLQDKGVALVAELDGMRARTDALITECKSLAESSKQWKAQMTNLANAAAAYYGESDSRRLTSCAWLKAELDQAKKLLDSGAEEA